MNKQENKVVLVACAICERSGPNAILNLTTAYPVELITNIITPTGFKPTTIPAYLCKYHFEEQEKITEKFLQEQNENNQN